MTFPSTNLLPSSQQKVFCTEAKTAHWTLLSPFAQGRRKKSPPGWKFRNQTLVSSLPAWTHLRLVYPIYDIRTCSAQLLSRVKSRSYSSLSCWTEDDVDARAVVQVLYARASIQDMSNTCAQYFETCSVSAKSKDEEAFSLSIPIFWSTQKLSNFQNVQLNNPCTAEK
jgi:hypothetical protein